MSNSNDNLISHIQQFFKSNEFKVSTHKYWFLINNANDDDDECLILEFKFLDNILFVSYLKKCGNHKGTQLLKLVEELAKSMSNINEIRLFDESEIDIGCGIEVSLSTFKIITKGLSWYNSLGYWSKNQEDEKIQNMKLIKTPFIEVFNSISNPKSTELLSKINRLFHKVDQNLNLDEYISRLYTISTSDNNTNEDDVHNLNIEDIQLETNENDDINIEDIQLETNENVCEKKVCFKELIFYLKPAVKYNNRLEKQIRPTENTKGGKQTKRRKTKNKKTMKTQKRKRKRVSYFMKSI